MTFVVVGKKLTSDIGELGAKELANDFFEYKSGSASFGDIFGRDKAFNRPKQAVEQDIWHVHMETPAVFAAWDSLWKRGFPQDNFTSDKILVYGRLWDVSRAPYLLVAILDPDGHDQMEDVERMAAISTEFVDEAQAYSRRLPSEQWVTSDPGTS